MDGWMDGWTYLNNSITWFVKGLVWYKSWYCGTAFFNTSYISRYRVEEKVSEGIYCIRHFNGHLRQGQGRTGGWRGVTAAFRETEIPLIRVRHRDDGTQKGGRRML